MTNEEKQKKEFVRFKANSLLMLSRKNIVSGKVGFFSLKNVDPSFKKDFDEATLTGEMDVSFAFPMQTLVDGYLGRGIPILVYETPIRVQRKYSLDSYYWSKDKNKKNFFWQIKFIFEEKLCVLYLTDAQYNHELVRAVPARIAKDYSLGKKVTK